MYVITTKEQLEGKYSGIFNCLADGRVYIHISEMRNVGTLRGVDIVTGRELTALKEQLCKQIKKEDKR